MATIIELVTFSAAPGVKDDEMIREGKKVEAILSKLPGYVSRSFAGPTNGEYADIVFWTDLKSAHDAAEQVMKIPEAHNFFKLIDVNTIKMRHLPIH